MKEDLRSTLEDGLRGFEPSHAAFDRTMRRVDRRRRVRRSVAGALALTISVAGLGFVVVAFDRANGGAAVHGTMIPTPGTSPTTEPLPAEIVGLDGGVVRRLGRLPSNARQLALSPDGTTIVFTFAVDPGPHASIPMQSQMAVYQIGDAHWHVIGWGDSKWEALGSDSPTWSPDGKRLAFVATTWTTSPWAHGIDVTGLHGGAHRVVTGAVGHPRWSSDGSKIAYVRVADVPGRPGHIYIVDVPNGKPHRLAEGDWPVFSPDGSRIAFVQGGEIMIINSDGTGSPQVLARSSNPEALEWSPDGAMIAFLAGRCGPTGDGEGVSVVDVASGAVKTVVRCRAGGVGSGPSWLPSGAALLVGGG